MELNNWVLSLFKSINTDSHVFTVYLVSPTIAMSKMLPTVPDLSGSQPENTAGRDAAPSRARSHLFTVPRAETHESWVTRQRP